MLGSPHLNLVGIMLFWWITVPPIPPCLTSPITDNILRRASLIRDRFRAQLRFRNWSKNITFLQLRLLLKTCTKLFRLHTRLYPSILRRMTSHVLG